MYVKKKVCSFILFENLAITPLDIRKLVYNKLCKLYFKAIAILLHIAISSV